MICKKLGSGIGHEKSYYIVNTIKKVKVPYRMYLQMKRKNNKCIHTYINIYIISTNILYVHTMLSRYLHAWKSHPGHTSLYQSNQKADNSWNMMESMSPAGRDPCLADTTGSTSSLSPLRQFAHVSSHFIADLWDPSKFACASGRLVESKRNKFGTSIKALQFVHDVIYLSDV